jgi:alpha-L-arabinofuranosidase
MANWGYVNTDGLGLIEYLDWAEDLNAVRLTVSLTPSYIY